MRKQAFVALGIMASCIFAHISPALTQDSSVITYNKIASAFGKPGRKTVFNDGSFCVVFDNLTPKQVLTNEFYTQYNKRDFKNVYVTYYMAFNANGVCTLSTGRTSAEHTNGVPVDFFTAQDFILDHGPNCSAGGNDIATHYLSIDQCK